MAAATHSRRYVAELFKILPELGRCMQARHELHLSELSSHPLAAKVQQFLRNGAPPTQTQLQLGIELALDGQCTVRELARRLGVTPAAVSLLVDRMEEHGFVERVRDEDDRRVVWVRLTPNAAAIVAVMLRAKRTLLETFIDETPAAEREPFVRNLARFARVMALTHEETSAKAG